MRPGRCAGSAVEDSSSTPATCQSHLHGESLLRPQDQRSRTYRQFHEDVRQARLDGSEAFTPAAGQLRDPERAPRRLSLLVDQRDDQPDLGFGRERRWIGHGSGSTSTAWTLSESWPTAGSSFPTIDYRSSSPGSDRGEPSLPDAWAITPLRSSLAPAPFPGQDDATLR